MKKVLIVALFLNALLISARIWQESPGADAGTAPVSTRNGDINGDFQIDIADPIALLQYLFLAGEAPVAIAQEPDSLTRSEVELLREILPHLSLVESPTLAAENTAPSESAKTLRFSGINVQVVSGMDSDEESNGTGNLIVGYNQRRVSSDSPGSLLAISRTGSHNLVVGTGHDFTSAGGFLAGSNNTVTAPFGSVSGGHENLAGNGNASVSGGIANRAIGAFSSISGGWRNLADAHASSASGGADNIARGDYSSATGGRNNTAQAEFSSVTGGGADSRNSGNVTESPYSSISGGFNNSTRGNAASVSGGVSNQANGRGAAVAGGNSNVANGEFSAVSGGYWNRAEGKAATISGGGGENSPQGNRAGGDYSTISGGRAIDLDTEAGHSP